MADSLRGLGVLTADGIRDAARRRIVVVVGVVCLLSLMMVESCTSCSADVSVQAQGVPAQVDVLGWTGALAFGLLALWIVVLAGLLAADHLSSVLEDGSALLVLARPVSRRALVLARLLGVLAVSLGAGLVVLGGAGLLIVTRSDLHPLPVLVGMVATGFSASTVAGFAMTASLYVPRIVTALGVFAVVGVVAVLNVVSMSGAELGGIYAVIDGYGPPIGTSLVMALAPWGGRTLAPADALAVFVRVLVWTAAAVSMLLFSFGSREVTDFEPR